MAFAPGYIATKLVCRTAGDMSWDTITPDEAAAVCFRDVGTTSLSHGTIAHEYVAWLIRNTPIGIRTQRGICDKIVKMGPEKYKNSLSERKQEYETKNTDKKPKTRVTFKDLLWISLDKYKQIHPGWYIAKIVMEYLCFYLPCQLVKAKLANKYWPCLVPDRDMDGNLVKWTP